MLSLCIVWYLYASTEHAGSLMSVRVCASWGVRRRQPHSAVQLCSQTQLHLNDCLYDVVQVVALWPSKGVVWLTRHSSHVIVILQQACH
jgi:hypothetical protein